VLDPAQVAALADLDEHPQRIDGYRITEVLGQGGMGVVYKAEQEEPVRRTVAIKLIKPGMDTREVVRRFATERQALARMTHPGIARVYDAGRSEQGRPYFVMEYVEGLPITEWCDRERQGLGDRLGLFVQICDAVQHAHQRGIIHRDLKPSNILVASQDRRPVPKIIDFGIARAVEQRPGEATALTHAGQVVGTLAYMSPEQAKLTGAGVDSRTDVYSLGVLLYELLAGRLPLDLGGSCTAIDEAFRRIRLEEPLRPSACSDGNSAEIAARRRTDPRSLARYLRGDLDWIALRALEKEPDRRYAAASELAADVRRHLAHEPVLARPPSTWYRVGKFARRHRVGVASVATIAVLLVVGALGTGVGLFRALRAERRALEQAVVSDEIASYFMKLFQLADPGEARGKTVTAREILDAQAATIVDRFPEQPGVRGRVMTAMGEAYAGLGLYAPAKRLLEESLPLVRAAYGDHRQVYDVLTEMGNLALRLDDRAVARSHFEEALRIAESTVGPDHPEVPPILKNLGDVCTQLGDIEAAQRYLERALAYRISHYGEENRPVARTLSSLAKAALRSGDTDRAIELAERSLEIRVAVLEPGDPDIAYGHLFLAEAQYAAGLYQEAEDQLDSALENLGRAYGTDDDRVAEVMFRLAKVRLKRGDPAGSYEAYVRARTILEKVLDPDNPDLAKLLANSFDEHASFLDEAGRGTEAAEIRQKSLGLRLRHGLD